MLTAIKHCLDKNEIKTFLRKFYNNWFDASRKVFDDKKGGDPSL